MKGTLFKCSAVRCQAMPPKLLRRAAILAAGFAAIFTFFLWPVCIPLSAADVASLQPPIEQRTDTDFYLRIFQKRDGQWCQCKTRISRVLFF